MKTIIFMRFLLLISIFLTACGKAPVTPELADAAPVAERYAAAVQRLDAMLDDGWVVSRDKDGNKFDQGDSLLFTGIAMHALPCDHATPLKESFLDGNLYRHPDQRDSAASLDGALGYFLGVAARLSRCHQGDDWQDSFAKFFNNDERTDIPQEFSYIKDKIGNKLGLRGDPSSDRRSILEAQIAVWAQATMSSHASCFRIHLGWVALRTLELLDDGPSENGKAAFCQASNGSDLPVVDNWCGRGNLIQWINDFQPNQWGYRHQRCPGWDIPDGNGREQPGVDYLLAIREAYNI